MKKEIKELLEKLAPHDPINQDEMGGCVWCAGTPPGDEYGYAGRDITHHKPDCPWVKARLILGDKLQDGKNDETTES